MLLFASIGLNRSDPNLITICALHIAKSLPDVGFPLPTRALDMPLCLARPRECVRPPGAEKSNRCHVGDELIKQACFFWRSRSVSLGNNYIVSAGYSRAGREGKQGPCPRPTTAKRLPEVQIAPMGQAE